LRHNEGGEQDCSPLGVSLQKMPPTRREFLSKLSSGLLLGPSSKLATAFFPSLIEQHHTRMHEPAATAPPSYSPTHSRLLSIHYRSLQLPRPASRETLPAVRLPPTFTGSRCGPSPSSNTVTCLQQRSGLWEFCSWTNHRSPSRQSCPGGMGERLTGAALFSN
jgi:hypothetical protein